MKYTFPHCALEGAHPAFRAIPMNDDRAVVIEAKRTRAQIGLYGLVSRGQEEGAHAAPIRRLLLALYRPGDRSIGPSDLRELSLDDQHKMLDVIEMFMAEPNWDLAGELDEGEGIFTRWWDEELRRTR